MPKLILDMNAMQEDFFAESSLIGLGTALPAYQLCWLLNQHFDLRFARDTEQNICLRKKDKQYIFPVYHFDIPNTYCRYLLYKLKNGSESLLPETRQLDYLWLVQTAEPEEDAHNILTSLKSIPDIQLSQILLPDQLKNLNNLLV
jgi:hypothetical protein